MSEEDQWVKGDWFIDGIREASGKDEYAAPYRRRLRVVTIAFERLHEITDSITDSAVEANSRLENIRAIVLSETEFEPASGSEAIELYTDGELPENTEKAIERQWEDLAVAVDEVERQEPDLREFRSALKDEAQVLTSMPHKNGGIAVRHIKSLVEDYESLWVTCFNGEDYLPAEGLFYTFGPIERVLKPQDEALHKIDVDLQLDF